jgi:sugar phosphate permease
MSIYSDADPSNADEFFPERWCKLLHDIYLKVDMGFLRYRYLVFGILGAAYVLVFFHRMAPAMLAMDMMHDLKTGGALIGIMASAYFYPYALMQIPAGLLSDSLGPRRSVTFFFIFAAAGSIAFGFAESVETAIIARVIVGLGVAMVFVPTLKILTKWFESADFVRMSGIFISLGGVGAYTAYTPLAMLSETAGWRASMVVIGAITAVVALAVWFLVRDTPQELGYQEINKATDPNPAASRIRLLRGMGMVLVAPRFWPMAICFFLSAAVSLSFNGLWGGPFLMQVYGMSKMQAGAVLSMFAFGLISGAPLMSMLSEKVFRSRKKLLVGCQFISLCLFVPIAFFTGDFNTPMLFIWCFVYSFLISGMIVIGYTTVKELFPVEIAGTATGLANIFPFAGAAVGQPLMGWYLDSVGSIGGHYNVDAYSAAFKICLFIIFGALVSSSFLKETFPKIPGE